MSVKHMESEMEFISVLKIILRWSWLIILIVGVTAVLLFVRERDLDPVYRAEVALIVSTPDREDVTISDEYTFTNDRDEVTTAINKFVTIAQYDEIKERTQEELDITENYTVLVNAELGADFVYIEVLASSPELAQSIANTHAEKAIAYFGELRGLPSEQALTYLDGELAEAQQAVREAETALLNFQLRNNIVAYDQEIDLQYEVLEQLEASRSQYIITDTFGLDAVGVSLDSQFQNPEPINVSKIAFENMDELVDTHRQALTDFAVLEPEYAALKTDVELARDRYKLLASEQTETTLRSSFAGQSMFIQVAQSARLPEEPVNNLPRTLVLGIAASLGLSLLLAFFLDYVFSNW